MPEDLRLRRSMVWSHPFSPASLHGVHVANSNSRSVSVCGGFCIILQCQHLLDLRNPCCKGTPCKKFFRPRVRAPSFLAPGPARPLLNTTNLFWSFLTPVCPILSARRSYLHHSAGCCHPLWPLLAVWFCFYPSTTSLFVP